MASLGSLTRKLEDTHAEFLQVQCEVVETLRSFYSSSSNISADEALKIAAKWSTSHSISMTGNDVDASDLQERMRRLNVALLDAVDRLQLDKSGDMAPEAQLLLSLTHKEQLTKQIQQSKTMLALIGQLTETDRLLGDVDESIGHHRFVAAAESIVKVEGLVHDLEIAEKRDGVNADGRKLIRVVKLQLLRKKNRLLNELTQYFASTVVWKDNTLKVATGFVDDVLGAIALVVDERRREFWKACEVLGILAPKMKDIAKAVSQHLIKPMLQMQRGSIQKIEDGSGVVLGVVAQSSEIDDASVKSGEAEIQDKCANVVKVLQFVYVELFGSTPELMNQLGDFMWKIPGNLEAQVMNLLQEKVPHDVTALDAYREVLMTSIATLENTLVAIGFSACSNSQLRGFVNRLSELHAKKRRQTILSSGRDLMRQGYHDSVKIMGASEKCCLNASTGSGKKGTSGEKKGLGIDDTPDRWSTDDVESSYFQVPNYRVTVCAHEVVELVHQTLVEACASGETNANLLFQTARDLFFLFRTVISTLYDNDIANDPRTCMLYHNDCIYITHHMLVVGHIYKDRLPAPLNQTATMVDMVPSFREVGDQALASFASAQMEEAVSGIKHLPSLGALDSEYDLERVEKFLKSALYKLNEMSSLWHEGLPLAVYNKIMSRMLEPLVKNFVDGVFTQTKISEKSGAYLHHLLSSLLESKTLFASPAQAAKFVPSMERLSKLIAILMDPLAMVRDKFNSGSLDMFSSKELAVLVRSRFRETPENMDFLQELLTA
ncbi:unnamed protein product [Peronospora effusa]|uniref:Uncharacterized protein n=1 Tax=Peronospora effusa TaxID=542832 RepID=A0A3R7XQS8_9STRA|nr:hypothetical protein DD237_007978 [Peronospora effusa]CAI5703414.1 unnamed protein product [Peronospora effusa]